MSKPASLTEAERAERRVRDREYARRAVEELRSSEGWKRWLTTRAAFHSYSFANQLLIAMQHPTATRVAGFRAWLKLGYCVTKGQTGIRIWAPVPPSKKQLDAWREAGADPNKRPRTHFKLTAVFAQDQVSELAPPAQPAPLDMPMRELQGDDLAPAWLRLVTLGEQIGSRVSLQPIPGNALGFYEVSTKRIAIEQHMSVNQQVATCCHEIAHALVRADRQDGDPDLDYASEELVVESVAFTCIRSMGITSDAKSIPYLASWAESADIGVIEKTAGLIDRLAKRIETALHDTTEQQATEVQDNARQPIEA